MTDTSVEEYRRIQAQKMSEETLLENIIPMAHTHGWLVAHFRPAKTDKGWRTPVQADGKGFLDLVMLREDGSGPVIFAELKSETGKLSHDQERWYVLLLNRQGSRTYLWRPSDWFSGEIERVLAGEVKQG